MLLLEALRSVDCKAACFIAHSFRIRYKAGSEVEKSIITPKLFPNPQTASSEVFLAGENERPEKITFTKP